MQKTKKQLLGLAGLAAVGIMTAVAYSLPTPAAAAENEPTSVEAGAQVQVRVLGADVKAEFISPSDGGNSVNADTKVSVDFNKANELVYQLTFKKDTNSTPITIPLGSKGTYTIPAELQDKAGVHNFDLDLDSYGYGFGEYTLQVVAKGTNHTSYVDTVTFRYSAATAEITGTEKNGDPNLEVDINVVVDKIAVTVYDKKGNPLTDKDGNPLIVELDRDAIDPETGNFNITLPFEEYNAGDGEYTIITTAYDKNGDILTIITTPFNYKWVDPNKPDADTPNTGFLTIGDLNITRLDYLLTGLIAFALVAGFALYLIARRNRNDR